MSQPISEAAEWMVTCPVCLEEKWVPIRKASHWLCACTLKVPLGAHSLHPMAQDLNSEIYDPERQPKPTMCIPHLPRALARAITELDRQYKKG